MSVLLNTILAAKNAGRHHIFLGHPLGDTADKTTVEPGNAFSPGLWTCGIGVWIETAEGVFSPDNLVPDQVLWQFDAPDGTPPVVRSVWPAGESVTVTSRLAHLSGRDVRAVDIAQITLKAVGEMPAKLHVVVRDVGPAGGPVEALAWNAEKRMLTVNAALSVEDESPLEIVFDQPPDEVLQPADQPADAQLAVFTWNLPLTAAETHTISFRAFHACLGTAPKGEVPPSEQAFVVAQERWNDAQASEVFAPDPRISRQWQQSLFHIASAMECGLPRIAAVDYPVLWVRGGTAILRALDLTGQHELARFGLDELAPMTFSGPFGAEADQPAMGIWALVNHAFFTRDEGWLRRIMPYVYRRVHLLEAMLQARKPMRVVGENFVPAFLHDRRKNLLCRKNAQGMIVGRQGESSPTLYLNAWASCGLNLASQAARESGRTGLALRWQQLARKIELTITERLVQGFAGNDELEATVVPYPTGILLGNRMNLRRLFEAWYKANRMDESGKPVHDRLYPYVELAQIHNAMQLGLKELLWPALDDLLGPAPDAEGRSAILPVSEGEAGGAECLPFGLPPLVRGWLNPVQAKGANMPNAWASAEMIQLLRSIFVVESEQRLILGLGVPEAWLKPGSEFGVSDLPTSLGTVSYHARVLSDGLVRLEYRGPQKWQAAFPVQPILRR